MKILKIFLFLFISDILYSERVNLDKIIAIAGDGIVMESQLNEAKENYLENYKVANPTQPLPPEDFIEERILENLIIEELQIQRAFKAGVRISDQELNESMSRLAANNNLSLLDFKKEIESQGQSYEKLRKEIKKEMIISRVQRGMVGPKIFISDQELNNFINSTDGQNLLVVEYKLDQILVKEEEKANEIISSLNQGKDFKELKLENDQSKETENEIIWNRISNIPTLFADTVTSMQLGEFKGPIKSGAGFHILFLEDKRGDTVKIEDQVLSRHILIQTSEVRSQSQAKKLIYEIKEKLINGESFEILARLYSDDPGSKLDGGILDWSSTDKYTTAFKNALDNSKINEITEPFESSFGWHIAEVLDRRSEDVSIEIQKNKAYRILFERKFQEQLETSLQEMRSQSFVEIKKRT